MLFKGPMGLGMTLTWLGVITGFTSLAGYWMAMRSAPEPAAKALPETPPVEAA